MIDALFAALADIARAVEHALTGLVATIRRARLAIEARRRSTIRRVDAKRLHEEGIFISVSGRAYYADGTPVDVRVLTRPYRREHHVRSGDIPDRYGNYPY